MRIRTIKPEFWNHPIMGRLPPAVQLLAIGLLNYSDDYGYFICDHRLINASLFALRPQRSLPKMIASLQKVGWIDLRTHLEMSHLGKVCAFSDHQIVNRPKPSELIHYWNEGKPFDNSVIDHGMITAGREGKGREGKGEGSGSRVVKSKKPKTPPNAPIAPRAKSRQEELYATFQETRRDVFEVDMSIPFVADEEHSPAFINASLAVILKACHDSTVGVSNLFEEFWPDAWASGLKPAWPFRAFVSDKTWPRLLEARRARKKLEPETKSSNPEPVGLDAGGDTGDFN